jgi:2-phosphoglycerate kinase
MDLPSVAADTGRRRLAYKTATIWRSIDEPGAPIMLIAFGGLPGTGKTTVAKSLARKLGAVYLRIDTLEQAFISSRNDAADIEPAGYQAAYAVADDNLRLGLTADQ